VKTGLIGCKEGVITGDRSRLGYLPPRSYIDEICRLIREYGDVTPNYFNTTIVPQ
jgi:hypothetical protein